MTSRTRCLGIGLTAMAVALWLSQATVAQAEQKTAKPTVSKTIGQPETARNLSAQQNSESFFDAGPDMVVAVAGDTEEGAEPRGPACAVATTIYNAQTLAGPQAFQIHAAGGLPHGPNTKVGDRLNVTGDARKVCQVSVILAGTDLTPSNITLQLWTNCPSQDVAGLPGGDCGAANALGMLIPNSTKTVTLTPVTVGTGINLVFDYSTDPNPPVITGNSVNVLLASNRDQVLVPINATATVGTGTAGFTLCGGVANFNGCGVNFAGLSNNMPFRITATTGPGACCTSTGTCISGPDAAQCAAIGGVYNGDGSICANVTCSGACCAADGTCSINGPTGCVTGGGIFRGTGSVCPPDVGAVTCFANQCIVDPQFPSLGCQLNDNEDGINGNFTNFRPAEDFRPTQNSITKICVFGIYTVTNPLPTSKFRLTYRANNSGIPGAALPGGTFEEGVTPGFTVAGPAATGQSAAFDANVKIFSWTLSHPAVAVTPNQCMWVEVTNEATGGTWFWVTAGAGNGNDYFAVDGLNTAAPNGFTAADITANANVNLAFCINNAAGNQQLDLTNIGLCATGSCCLNDCPFTCVSGLTQAQCTALSAGAAWTPGGDCSQTCFTNAIECCRADMNGDGKYNGLDVQQFVRAISPLGNLACSGNEVTFCRANLNEDAVLNTADIPGFVAAMLNNGNETNDRCCGVQTIVLTGPTTTVVANNTNATGSPSDPTFPCSVDGTGRGTNTLWFKFVATDTSVAIDCETSVAPADDSILALYEGSCDALTQLACDDDSGTGLLSRICATGLTVGNTYFIQLASFEPAAAGAYNLNISSPCPDVVARRCCTSTGCQLLNLADCAAVFGDADAVGTDCTTPCPAAPLNDACTNPVTVVCGGGAVSMDNTNATIDPTDPALPCHFGGPTQRGRGSVWARFTATASTATIVVGGAGTADDSVMALYDGLTCPPVTQLFCDDDGGPDFLSQIAATGLTPGNQYLIEITALTNLEKGPYTVSVTCP